MPKNLEFFSCVNCSGTTTEIHSDSLICTKCGKRYSIIHDIPILINDWQSHENEIESLASIKPNWYVTEQNLEESGNYKTAHRKRRVYVEKKISEWLSTKNKDKVEKLLDLGCGDGNHLNYLKKYGKFIFGSDYNLTRLVRANLRFPDATLFLADLLEYPSKQNFFDLIFFHHVIEHISDDMKALDTIYKILSPGGLLILGTPNEGASWWQFAYKVQPTMLEQTDHVQFYTANSLKLKLEKAGFRILDIKHIGWGVPHFSLDEKLRRYKLFDDFLETLGQKFFKEQSTSLYVLATKE